MTIPFYTLNIHQPLQQMLDDADNSGEWQAIIEYCEPLIETTTDDGVILCYSFALMEQAIAIHVDDVESTAEYCLTLLKRLQHTYGGTDHWKRMLKRIIRQAKDLQKKDNDLLKIPYENLTASERTTLAYNIQVRGSIENYTRAAEIHFDLMAIKQDAEKHYHIGQYIICLYNSNQIKKADVEFEKLLAWAETNSTHGYAFLVGTCFQEKLLYYKNDAIQLQAIWEAAMKHPAINKDNGFPYAEPVQDEIIIAADRLDLIEIKNYLAKIISEERKKRNIPDTVNKIIENI